MAVLEDLKPRRLDPRHPAQRRRHRGQRAMVRLRRPRADLQGPSGRVANELLYRDREADLEVVEAGRPWSFDGDGALFRLVSEAQRIRLAHLFDPVLAVHTSLVEPLPHQITAVYEAMLPRQPLRFLLADDPGAGKTIMAGLADQGTDRPRRLAALSRRLPRQPGRAVAGRTLPPLPTLRSRS